VTLNAPAVAAGAAHAYRRRIFWTLFGGYAAYYLCRVNLSIAQPELEKLLGKSKMEMGIIASTFYGFYAVGKLLNGIAADWLGGRLLFTIGVLGSAAANIAFSLVDSLDAMTAVWAVNGFFQSMGWGALVNIMSRWYGREEQGTVMGFLSANYQLGHAASWGILGLLALSFPWQGLFYVPAIAFAAVGVACFFLLRNDPREVGLPSPHADAPAEVHEGDRAAARLVGRSVVRALLLNPYFWTVCLISFLLTFIRYTFVTWAPSYLSERGSGISVSAFQAAVYPLIGSLGSVFAGWYSDRFSKSQRAPIIAWTCLGLTVGLVAFGFAADFSIWGSVLLLAFVGFTLYGPYSLLAGAIAIDLGSRHASATAAGIIDGVGYVGAILSGSGMGWLIDKLGWESSFLALAGASFVCVLAALAMRRMRPAGGGR
jgi:sugar phosphate permease